MKNRTWYDDFLYPMNYIIGHGLFITRDIIAQIEYFSENTHNEDAVFGLELSYRREYICPVPYFDKSSSPDSVNSLFFQKTTWFFGPFQAPVYYKKLKQKIPKINNRRLGILSCKMFALAIVWILNPTLMFILFLNYFFSGGYEFFPACLVFLVYPNFISYLLTKDHIKIKDLPAFAYIIVGSFIAYTMHGMSAYYSILQSIKALLFKKEVNKYKTKIIGA